MPTNPNMRQAKLVGVLEELGFTRVRGFISSGNLIFESRSRSPRALEAQIEKAWPEKLGFSSATLVRSEKEIRALLAKRPFGDVEFSRKNYHVVTFLKRGGELFATVDTTQAKTPNLMAEIERRHGKELTTRTWNTVTRVAKLLDDE